MSAKNIQHNAVVRALRTDGWTITHDPLTLPYRGRNIFADLGAEGGPLAADRAGRKIAVEIQSFLHQSAMHSLHSAIGQYVLYRLVLQEIEADRLVYLAVAEEIADSILAEPIGQLAIAKIPMSVLVFHPEQERID